jgi:GT2 family glycosyltransferase
MARFIGDMRTDSQPTISAVVAAYQAEQWIAEALEAILGQTRPPDEVIVVDDGSTDGTAQVLERFADRIRVVRQPNSGCPAAFNRAFHEARGDFVAMCGADDIWEPNKLEWQMEAIEAHPEADVLFGHAVLFGRLEGEHAQPSGSGLLDSERFRADLFRENSVPAPTVVIRRALFERLGPFVENFGADDYEYWFRCLRAGARFYYDPRPLLRWRQHGDNLSWKTTWMDECTCQTRRWYERDVADRGLVNQVLAPLLFKVARQHVESGRTSEARDAFRACLRFAPGNIPSANARALVWVMLLSLPTGVRARAARTGTTLSRAVDALRGGRDPALP